MHKAVRLIVKWVVFSESIFLLLPLTLGFAFLILISLHSLGAGIFSNGTLPNMEICFAIGVIEALTAYGLFAIWWLVLNYSKISIKQIPKIALYGLIVGVAINLLIIASILAPIPSLHAGKLRLIDLKVVIYLAGSLIILLTLTSLMFSQNKQA